MKRFICSLVFLSSILVGFSQDLNKVKSQKARIEREIKDIEAQLNSTKKAQEDNLENIQLIQLNIRSRKQLISEINNEIKSTRSQISSTERGILENQADIDTLVNKYQHLVLSSYKHRDPKIWVVYLLGSENIGQGLRRWSYLKQINNKISDQIERIQDAQSSLLNKKTRLEKLQADLARNQKKRNSELSNLQLKEKRFNETSKSLQKKQRSIAAQQLKKKKEIEAINKEIEKIIAIELKKLEEAKKKKTVNYALSNKFYENRGKLPYPVSNGVIVQGFGKSYHPVFKSLELPFNNGVDISSKAGSSALSVFNGVVKQIIYIPGYSQCVLIQHGEYFTFYCKLSEISVKVGQQITTGQKLGTIEESDNGTSVIHFQVWKGTQKQDPGKWIRKN